MSERPAGFARRIKQKPEAGRQRALHSTCEAREMLTTLTPSCSVIIHQTINAESVNLTVTGSVVVAIALVAALAIIATAAVVVTVRAFRR